MKKLLLICLGAGLLVVHGINAMEMSSFTEQCKQLRIAADAMEWDKVESLLADIVKMDRVNEQDAHGRTALWHLAACKNDVLFPREQLLEPLLSAHADARICSEERRAPLFMAAANGHTLLVRRLLQYDPSLANLADIAGSTPLLVAIEDGHKNVVEFLLAAGADPNHAVDGMTPLTRAVKINSTDIVYALLEAGAWVDALAPSEINATPLHIAARQGRFLIARLLVEAGANVHAHAGCMTPLDLATTCDGLNGYYPFAEREKNKIAELLLAHGAKVDDVMRKLARPSIRSQLTRALHEGAAHDGAGSAAATQRRDVHLLGTLKRPYPDVLT